MKVLQQPLGPVQANCYLVMEGSHALIIDPADMYPNLECILKENECSLEAIVLAGTETESGAFDTCTF